MRQSDSAHSDDPRKLLIVRAKGASEPLIANQPARCGAVVRRPGPAPLLARPNARRGGGPVCAAQKLHAGVAVGFAGFSGVFRANQAAEQRGSGDE